MRKAPTTLQYDQIQAKWLKKVSMYLLAVAIALGAAAITNRAHAAQDAATIQKTPETILAELKNKYPKTSINSIRTTEISGLYEVSMGNQVAYTDGNSKYLLFGHIFDMETQMDITQARLDDMNKIDFSKERLDDMNKIDFAKLPFEKSIKIVKGAGQRTFAVFSDPDCVYCRKLEETLKEVDNYTMYVFLFPITSLHPMADIHAKTIWCAKNRSTAWTTYMTTGRLPEGKGDCVTPVSDIAELARSFRIQGTPTLFNTEGKKMPGALPVQQLEAFLGGQNEAGKKVSIETK